MSKKPNPQYIFEGSLVEFLSDRQTDKGPATGTVLISTGQEICVQFADEQCWFDSLDLLVERVTTSTSGQPLWQLV